MMKTTLNSSVLLLTLGLVGCGALGPVQSVASDPLGVRGGAGNSREGGRTDPSGWGQDTARSDVVLYARDGSPVGPAPLGVVLTTDQPMPHGMQQGVESRIVLLDLYQQAVDERDELLLELELLDRLQTQSNMRVRELEEQLAARQISVDEALSAKRALELQNFELADRLAASTMLRLEAEKKYLETAIAVRSGSLESAGIDVPEAGDDQ